MKQIQGLTSRLSIMYSERIILLSILFYSTSEAVTWYGSQEQHLGFETPHEPEPESRPRSYMDQLADQTVPKFPWLGDKPPRHPVKPEPESRPWMDQLVDQIVPQIQWFGPKGRKGHEYQDDQDSPKDFFGQRVSNARTYKECCNYGQCRYWYDTCTDCNTCVKKYDFLAIGKCKLMPSGSCLNGGPNPGPGPVSPYDCRPESRPRCTVTRDCYRSS